MTTIPHLKPCNIFPKYLVGQRVFLNDDEIGTVVATPPRASCDNADVWVHSPTRGYESCYSKHNVRPLPNGQL